MIPLVLLLEDLVAPFAALAVLLAFAFSRRRKVLLGLGDELRERLGGGPPPPPRPLVWVHCASAGEVNAAAPLIQRLAARPSRPAVLVTTLTAAGRARARGLEGVSQARLAPLDAWPFFHRFLASSRPSALILVETELWPHMIARVSEAAPVALVNARVSDRSFGRYRLARPLVAPFLRRLTRVCAQSERDAQRLRELGAPAERVSAVGNLKLDAAAAAPASSEAARAVEALGWAGRPLFVAGSTHPGEERAVIDAFRAARAEFPSLALVIAPRHVERAAQTVSSLEAAGLRASRLSAPSGRPDVLVLDRLGVLAAFYPLAALSFVGGTLVPVGGHSVLEPALAGSFVCFGPHVENTLEPARLLESAGAALTVESGRSLGQALKDALKDPARARAQGELARKTAQRLRGAADRTLKELEDVLARAGV